jgi:hypothetical protein
MLAALAKIKRARKNFTRAGQNFSVEKTCVIVRNYCGRLCALSVHTPSLPDTAPSFPLFPHIATRTPLAVSAPKQPRQIPFPRFHSGHHHNKGQIIL